MTFIKKEKIDHEKGSMLIFHQKIDCTRGKSVVCSIFKCVAIKCRKCWENTARILVKFVSLGISVEISILVGVLGLSYARGQIALVLGRL